MTKFRCTECLTVHDEKDDAEACAALHPGPAKVRRIIQKGGPESKPTSLFDYE